MHTHISQFEFNPNPSLRCDKVKNNNKEKEKIIPRQLQLNTLHNINALDI